MGMQGLKNKYLHTVQCVIQYRVQLTSVGLNEVKSQAEVHTESYRHNTNATSFILNSLEFSVPIDSVGINDIITIDGIL